MRTTPGHSQYNAGAVTVLDLTVTWHCLYCGVVLSVYAGFQAFADPDTGAVTAVDADMSFNSSSVRLVVVGRGPLGAFTAKVSAVQMEGTLLLLLLCSSLWACRSFPTLAA